eukprot:9489638-Pyramimonas_sp.AAC.1
MAETYAGCAIATFGGAPMGSRNVRGCAGMRSADACGLRHLGLLWKPYVVTKRVKGGLKWVAGARAGCATWTFGGALAGSRNV